MKYTRLLLFCLLTIALQFFFPFSTSAQANKRDTFSVYFAFNSYSVNNDELLPLNSFLNKLVPTDSPKTIINIIGYTDTVGTEKYNAALSMRRCQSLNSVVENQLSSLQKFSIQLMPMGEKNATTQPASLNRRVDLVFSVPVNKVETAAEKKLTDALSIENKKQVSNSKDLKEKVIDTIIVLDNIYFEPDLPVLTPGSLDALPYYFSILKKY
jgi:outer membrane protein OmpA-like peptidoglycan-associated protein